jgi:putative transposase
MKDKYVNVSLSHICRLLGITRQSYYQHSWRQEWLSIEEDLVIQEVLKIRQHHRHMGGRKIFEKLQPFFVEHQIKMGRDRLFDVLADNQLLVKRRKRRVSTTQSSHWLRKYPNLIKGFESCGINQLWVSDITYWRIQPGFVYISFITDTFSHKVVGYHVAETLEAVETLEALKMALNKNSGAIASLIHHSERAGRVAAFNTAALHTSKHLKTQELKSV